MRHKKCQNLTRVKKQTYGILTWYAENYCRSQQQSGLRRGSAAARLQGFRVRIQPAVWISVSCECSVLSGRVLCNELITLAENFYQA